jgi:hypothetical protein
MKKFTLLLMVTLCFTARLKAQQPIGYIDFKKHIGKTATLCDTVYGVKLISDTLTYIYLGGNYPNQKFTVVVVGNKLVLDWVNLKKKHLCVTGVLELYKNTLQITAAEPDRITVN